MSSTRPGASLSVIADRPFILLPADGVDVGTVRLGHTKTGYLPVTNPGASELSVSLESDTPWVEPPAGPVVVPPGETASIELVISPPARSEPGPLHATVALAAPGVPFFSSAQVEVRGELFQPVTLLADSSSINLGGVRVDAGPLEGEVAVTRSDGLPARLCVAVECPDEDIARGLAASATPDGHVRLTVHTANLPATAPPPWWWPFGHPVDTLELVVRSEDKDIPAIHLPASFSTFQPPRLGWAPGRAAGAAREGSGTRGDWDEEAASRVLGETAATAVGRLALTLYNSGGETLHVRIRPGPDAPWLTAQRQTVRLRPRRSRTVWVDYDLTRTGDVAPWGALELESNDGGDEKSRRRVLVSMRRLLPRLSAAFDPAEVVVSEGNKTVPVTLTVSNHGEGAADASLTEVPEWLSFRESRLRIPPGGSVKLKGVVSPHSRSAGQGPQKVGVSFVGAATSGRRVDGITTHAELKTTHVLRGARRRRGLALLLLLLVLAVTVGGAGYAGLRRWQSTHPSIEAPAGVPADATTPTPEAPSTPQPQTTERYPSAQAPSGMTPAPEIPTPEQPQPVGGIDDLIAQARSEKALGHPYEAIRILRDDVLPRALDNDEAHWVLAWCYAEREDWSDAGNEFRAVINTTTDPAWKEEARKALGRIEAR